MRPETSRRLAAALLTAAAAWPMAGTASAQGTVPVPTASPVASVPAGAAASAPVGSAAGSAGAGPATPPVDVPVPEARPAPPEPSAQAPPAPAAPPVPAPTPEPEAVPTPAPAPSSAGEEGVESPAPPEPGAPPAAAAEPTPQPAYVVPDEARTTAEPTAPETPPMEVTPAETVDAAAAVEDAMLCEAELKKRGAAFAVGETIAEGDCGVLRPIELTRLSAGVAIAPGTTFLCRTALALDIWMSDSVEPAAKAELGGATVESISQASTYVCRARASESKISEHSRGSAIDIAALTLSDGRSLTVEAQAPGSAEDRFSAAIRRSACGPFKTVLGPGTDSAHGTHLHLDIAARSNGSLYCR